MKNILKKLISWLRCEDERPACMWQQNAYSENIKHFPIHGKIGDDDIVQLSHKLEDGGYETCYVLMKDIKEYFKS